MKGQTVMKGQTSCHVEKAFVAAVGALESGEAGSEVAAAKEGLDGGGGGGVDRAEGLAVFAFVVGKEGVPAVVDELPEGRGAAGQDRRGWIGFGESQGG